MGSGKKKDPKPDNTKVIQSIEKTQAPSALQKMLDERAMRYFDWDAGRGEFAGRPKDVMDAPGMDLLEGTYGSADSLAQQRQIGNPQNAFGAGANPNFSKQLEQLGSMDRYNTRASGLMHGLRDIGNKHLGIAESSIGNEMSRNQAAMGGYLGHQANYYNRPQKQNPWMTGLSVLAGGLSRL